MSTPSSKPAFCERCHRERCSLHNKDCPMTTHKEPTIRCAENYRDTCHGSCPTTNGWEESLRGILIDEFKYTDRFPTTGEALKALIRSVEASAFTAGMERGREGAIKELKACFEDADCEKDCQQGGWCGCVVHLFATFDAARGNKEKL